MALKSIHFYFDYISPYAYFAWHKLPSIAKKFNCLIEVHPVVFGKLLDKWGQLGPAEIPPKKKWLNEYCLRYAAINKIEYNPPKKHPFNPLASLRMSLKAVSGINQLQVIDTIFKGGWGQGKDLGDLATLISLLEKKSIDGNSAIEKGIFGVPSIIIDDNLFWGNDQIEYIELLLAGKDPLDKKKLNAHEARSRGIDRKALKKLDTNR